MGNADIAAESIPAEHCARHNLANIKAPIQRVVALLQVLADDGIEGHFGTSTAPVGGKTSNECSRNADERPLRMHPDIPNAVAAGKNSAIVLLVEDEPLIPILHMKMREMLAQKAPACAAGSSE